MEVEGWRERVPAAAARLEEAREAGWMLPLAWAWVLRMLCPLIEAVVDGVGMLRVEREELLRWRREGVGCVAPVIWWVGFGSEISMGRSEAEVEVLECDAFEATEADWARRAVSSRVRRLTWGIALALYDSSIRVSPCTHHCFLLFLTLRIQLSSSKRSGMPEGYTSLLVVRRDMPRR